MEPTQNKSKKIIVATSFMAKVQKGKRREIKIDGKITQNFKNCKYRSEFIFYKV